MKSKIIIIVSCILMGCMTSCTEWLEIYPQNAQVSDYYWSSKEEVDAMVNGGYYYLRDMVTSQLIPFGELRGGCVFSRSGGKLQEFRVKETDKAFCNWGPFYTVINVANGVLANADKALKNDDTYDENMMNSHKSEAYFLRALCYFYLVRNWQNVPLILKPYEDDSYEYKIGQSSEAEVIAQIKKDIVAAIPAAKEQYDKTWENKGRATKWALYALMADVCLWSEDYATAEKYCNYILMADSKSSAPSFLKSATHATWFSMFNPGNSNESIFEVQWDRDDEQWNTLPTLFDNSATGRVYEYSLKMLENFTEEYTYTQQKMLEAVRTMYGGYYVSSPSTYETATNAFVWKYMGATVLTEKRTSDYYDPNFIIYRVADVILMKAEALVMQGQGRWAEAIELINQVRNRSNLANAELDATTATEVELLEAVLYERTMELAGEGKAWYDMLRFGRRNNYQYKDIFLVSRMLDYNQQASASWFRSVLANNDALFLPVWKDELDNNSLLVQNPYYKN